MTKPTYIKTSKAELEELDYIICAHKRKVMSIIDLSQDDKEIKEYVESMDNLDSLQKKVRKEILKK